MRKLTKAAELATKIDGFVSFAPWGRVSASAGLYREAKSHELVWLRRDGEWLLASVNAAGEVLKTSEPITPEPPVHASGKWARYGCPNRDCILHHHPRDVRCRYPANLPASPNERLVGSAVQPKRPTNYPR